MDLKRRLYPAESLELAGNLKNLAELERRQSRFHEAEKIARESIAIREKRLGPRHVLTVEAQNTLALVLHATGRLKEAEQLFLRVLAQRDLLPQRDHLETAVLSNLGGLYGDMGDYPSAERYLGECIAIRRKELGPKHPRLAVALIKLARIQESAGKFAEADRSLRETLAIQQAVYGGNHPDVARTLLAMSSLDRRRGRFREARQTLMEAAAIREAGTEEPDSLSAWRFHDGLLRESEGDLTGAERALHQALDERSSRLGPRNVQVGRTMLALGRVLVKRGQYDRALAMLQRAVESLSAQGAAGLDNVAEAQSLIASLRTR